MNETVQPDDMTVPDVFDSTKKCIEEIEGRYGADSIVLAEELEAYAKMLREQKGSLMEAFNAESRAKAIRSNFNKDPLHDEIARNLKKRAKHNASSSINEPLICLVLSAVCGIVGALMCGATGGCAGVIFAAGSWFKALQWRISKLWFFGGLLSFGISDLAFTALHVRRFWAPAVLQIVFMAILGCLEFQKNNSPVVVKNPDQIAAQRTEAMKKLEKLGTIMTH